MPFPGSRNRGLQKSTPILVTATSTIAVPANAKFVHAYIVGGGGGGGATANTAGTAVTSSGGGGGGGAAYIGVDLDQWQLFGEFSSRNSRASVITATIGSGGTGQTRSTTGGTPGGTGGTTTFAINGGFSLSVSGGAAGNQNTSAAGLITPSTSYGVLAAYGARGPILLRPLMAFPPQYSSTNFGGDTTNGLDVTPTGGSVTNTVSSEVGNNGGALSTFVLIPWWLQSVGLTRGSGGTGIALTGTGRAAGGGGSGFGGNGGNGAASNTAGTVTGGAGGGYGAGGGGAAGVTGSTVTSGSGAPGCCVILFELEV